MTASNNRLVELLDTTLRDGEQDRRVSFSPESAVRVVYMLDGTVDIIEAGFAGANPDMDRRFKLLHRAQQEHPLKSRIAAFGMTRAKHTTADNYAANPLIAKLVEAMTPIVVIVGKTWDYHVRGILKTSLEENLRMIRDTVSYFKSMGKDVIFDAELFTSAMLKGHPDSPPNAEYALDCLETAIKAGSSRVVLCDTLGILLTERIPEVIGSVTQRLGSAEKIGYHGHDDSGMAVANTKEMWNHGVSHLQVTVNGMGERAGNTALEALAAALTSPYASTRVNLGNMSHLYGLSREVSLLGTGRLPSPKVKIVGDDTNADKAGLHAAGMSREPLSYRGRDLEKEFGTPQRVVISNLGGRANIAMKLGLEPSDPYVAQVSRAVDRLSGKGYDFAEAEASFYVLAEKLKQGYQPLLTIVSEKFEEKDGGRVYDTADLEVIVGGQNLKIHANGKGLVDAFYNAVKKALLPKYPAINDIRLRRYTADVEIREGGTEQPIPTILTWSLNGTIYRTMGVSTSILEASREAIMDGLEYGIMLRQGRQFR